jgi:16S rRNA (uracil1498-N3)-methyltransferase
MNKHLFALYYLRLSHELYNERVVIHDAALIHRITRVLRLRAEDRCILFDRVLAVECTITAIERHQVTATIIRRSVTQPVAQKITFFLPFLKREALTTAVYDLVQAGVQEIRLMHTAKSAHLAGDTHDMLDRLERVIIAAAEQSKNFAFPTCMPPISFAQTIELLAQAPSYVGDPGGTPFFQLFAREQVPAPAYALVVGPEGGFTPQEQEELAKTPIVPVQLTPTILKAETAAFYLAALMRSRCM